MNYDGIVITGTSGSGKSTIAGKLCERNTILKRVLASTTREHRYDDEIGSYEYVTDEAFQELISKNSLLANWEYRSKLYGIKMSYFQSVLSENKVPLLIISPTGTADLVTINKKFNFFTIFLDAKDETLDQHLSNRPGGEISKEQKEQISWHREKDRSHKDKLLYSIENNDVELDDLFQLIESLWDHKNIEGVLLKSLIISMIKCGMLVLDANIDNVSGAYYVLRLGDQYIKQKETRELSTREPFLTIEPRDYVIVSAKETAYFPKDIAARFDLSVDLLYKGITLVNTPQVDPGHRGELSCILFNTSNRPVQLRKESHYATIEFIKLLESPDNHAENTKAEKVGSSSYNTNRVFILRA